jgi:PKD repeat protein
MIIDPGQQQTSSSSAGTPVTGLGDCKPVTSPIEKEGSVAWQFVGNTALYKPMEFATFTYEWDFGELGTGSGFKTDAITYPASGKYTATVTVTTKDGSTETKVCKDTLQVNGDKITCTCAAAGGDITTDAGVATWTATCTSASEINKYIWDGVEGVSTTFTHTFAAKGDAYKPTLKVGNTDKTEITVETCPQVTATDASLPDYFLTATEKAKDFAAAGEYDIQIQFDCSSNMTFYCQGSGVEVSATVESVALSNQGKTKDYYIFGTLPASACSGSAFVHLVLTGGAAKCGMQ